jgi:hypothetical protein
MASKPPNVCRENPKAWFRPVLNHGSGAAYSVSAWQAGMLFRATADDSTFDLPDIAVDDSANFSVFHFQADDAVAGITVNVTDSVPAGIKVYFNGVDKGTSIALPPGSSVTLVAIDATRWEIVSQVGVYAVSTNMGGIVNRHDLTHDPVALWQLDWSLADSSGNDFTLTKHTEAWGGMPFGQRCGFLVESAFFNRAYDALLDIKGAVTVEALIKLSNLPDAPLCIFTFGATGEAQDVNSQYSLQLLTDLTLLYIAEYGYVATDVYYNPTDYRIPLGEVVHIAMTRSSSQVVRLYIDGLCVGTSAAMHAPDGGEHAESRIGWGCTAASRGASVSSVKIIAAELTPGEVAAEALRCLGFVWT